MNTQDLRLIERSFLCHQVGAEAQRERGASSALPPIYCSHVWWARHPLTPSRAAIVASLANADTDPEIFIRQLGIERVQALVQGEPWTLDAVLIARVRCEASGAEVLPVDAVVFRTLQQEDERRANNRELIVRMIEQDSTLAKGPVLVGWSEESKPLPQPWPTEGEQLLVRRVMGDPAWFNVLMTLGQQANVRIPNLYGYERAFNNAPDCQPTGQVILDPTAGGGSIPFEALRLGHTVIANELNPVATTILYATLNYPARFGPELSRDIRDWGNRLLTIVEDALTVVFPRVGPLPGAEQKLLEAYLTACPEWKSQFDQEEVTTYIFTRQVTCPHCGGEGPLLNTCWLSKEAADPWGVRIVPDGRPRGGKVTFQTYRVVKGRGPHDEDPNLATVDRGVGQCVHCQQAIPEDEIKAQAHGESPHGHWSDRLYCVVAVRLESLLDENGQPMRYTSGLMAGEIKTRKVRFFRPPNDCDLQALEEADKRLQEKWPAWEAAGLVPAEEIPERSNYNRGHRLYGMTRCCDLFAPRQLLGHLTLIEGLNRLKPEILAELGADRGQAVVTYLQFAIDKGLDYNSRMTRWEYTRGIVKGTFGSHNFSLKWTFGEMIFTGPNSGAA